jgi:hypothetical protein
MTNYTRQGNTFGSRTTGGVDYPTVDVAPLMPVVVSGAQYNLAVSTSVVTLTVPSGATHALITVSTNDVNFTEDGSTPSATNGLRLPAGFVGELSLPQALKFIRVSADAVLNVSYRKYTTA